MQLWNNFAAKHPAAAKWVREGGLFVIVSNLVTVFKYLLLQFLPAAFSSLPVVDFGWPGIPVTLFGETFQWNILGYDSAHGGLPYFCAYMVAMVVGECINFPIQRNFVFRSKGNLAKQIAWYVVAFCLITCIVNSINCVWVAVYILLLLLCHLLASLIYLSFKRICAIRSVVCFIRFSGSQEPYIS